MGAPGGRGTSTVSNIHWPAIVLWAPGWHVHESHWWKQLPTGQWVQDPAGPVQAMPPLLDEHPPLALDLVWEDDDSQGDANEAPGGNAKWLTGKTIVIASIVLLTVVLSAVAIALHSSSSSTKPAQRANEPVSNVPKTVTTVGMRQMQNEGGAYTRPMPGSTSFVASDKFFGVVVPSVGTPSYGVTKTKIYHWFWTAQARPCYCRFLIGEVQTMSAQQALKQVKASGVEQMSSVMGNTNGRTVNVRLFYDAAASAYAIAKICAHHVVVVTARSTSGTSSKAKSLV